MKRGLLTLFALLLLCLVTSVAVAQSGDHPVQNKPQPLSCPIFENCIPTPVPQSGGNPAHPGDEDGDGIPDGIDLCPNQGGPSSNQGCPPGVSPVGSAPTPVPTVALPILPTSGGCVLATRSDEGVNIRSNPSTSAQIVGVLDPQMTYPVLATLDNAEGTWDRIAQGWVAQRVVRLGGTCDTVPVVDEPGATDVNPLGLSFPDGFALTLDKGDGGGEDTPQGYCAPSFNVDLPGSDGSTDTTHFNFSNGAWCIKLHTDAHGVDLWPPGPCDPTPGALPCDNVVVHLYVGFGHDPSVPIVIAIIQPNSTAPGVLLSWQLWPPGPCKPGDQSCSTHGGEDFAFNWALENANENQPGQTGNPSSENPTENQPGLTISWALENANENQPGQAGSPSSENPTENQPGLTISWALENANESQPNFTIRWLPDGSSQETGTKIGGPAPSPGVDSGFEYGGFLIGGGQTSSPAPNFQGFGIDGVPGVSAEIAIILPAVQ